MSCGSGDVKFGCIYSGWGRDDDVKAVSIGSAQSFVNQLLGLGNGPLSALRGEEMVHVVYIPQYIIV